MPGSRRTAVVVAVAPTACRDDDADSPVDVTDSAGDAADRTDAPGQESDAGDRSDAPAATPDAGFHEFDPTPPSVHTVQITSDTGEFAVFDRTDVCTIAPQAGGSVGFDIVTPAAFALDTVTTGSPRLAWNSARSGQIEAEPVIEIDGTTVMFTADGDGVAIRGTAFCSQEP